MKHLLIIFSILLLSSPLFGQSERPETIVIPVSSLGDVSEVRKQILQNTLTDELKKHFRIVPQEKYKQALEQVFEELEYEECSEDICIMKVQQILQVENVFNLQIIGEGKDSQLNLKWNTLDEKKNETDVCLGCGTFQLNDKVRVLVEKLVGEKRVEVVVQKKPIVVVEKKPVVIEKIQGDVIFCCVASGPIKEQGKWFAVGYKNKSQGYYVYGDGRKHKKYEGEVENGEPNGRGKLSYPDGRKWVGEFKFGEDWNTIGYDIDNNIIGKVVNGRWKRN